MKNKTAVVAFILGSLVTVCVGALSQSQPDLGPILSNIRFRYEKAILWASYNRPGSTGEAYFMGLADANLLDYNMVATAIGQPVISQNAPDERAENESPRSAELP